MGLFCEQRESKRDEEREIAKKEAEEVEVLAEEVDGRVRI